MENDKLDNLPPKGAALLTRRSLVGPRARLSPMIGRSFFFAGPGGSSKRVGGGSLGIRAVGGAIGQGDSGGDPLTEQDVLAASGDPSLA